MFHFGQLSQNNIILQISCAHFPVCAVQIPEYCHSMDEAEILDNAFNLIFAFDEIVALGYRESVNLAQIRTFVEMDSHEEKVYQAVRQVRLCNFNKLSCTSLFN